MAIDYDKLAAEHGGAVLPTEQYDSLAAQFGGSVNQPAGQPQMTPDQSFGPNQSFGTPGGIMDTASSLFSNTGKFFGGAILKAADAQSQLIPGDAGYQATQSQQQLDKINEMAMQKVRSLLEVGDTNNARRLFDVVQQGNADPTITDRQFKSSRDTATQIAGQGLGAFAEQAMLARGIGLPNKIASLPAVQGATSLASKFVANFPRLAKYGSAALSGAGYLGGINAANALQEENPTLGDVAKKTLIGAGEGALFGTTLQAGGAALGAGRKYFFPNLSEAKATYKEALNLGRAELKKFDSTTEVDDLVNLFIDEGVPLQTQDKGTKFATREASDVLKTSGDTLEESLQSVLNQYKGAKYVDLVKASEIAKANVRRTPNLAADIVNRRIAEIDNQLAQELERHGGQFIDPPTANIVKRGQWGMGYDLMSGEKKNAARYFGNALKTEIENAVGGDQIVKKINSRLGLIQDGIDFLGKMEGKAIRGGRLGHGLNRIGGQIIGAKFGPIGSFVGGEISSTVSKYLSDPELITTKAIKSMQQSGIIPETVKTVDQAKQFIEALKTQRAGALLLPPPAIRLPGDTSGFNPNALNPKILPYEARPGQLALPPGRNMSGATIRLPEKPDNFLRSSIFRR